MNRALGYFYTAVYAVCSVCLLYTPGNLLVLTSDIFIHLDAQKVTIWIHWALISQNNFYFAGWNSAAEASIKKRKQLCIRLFTKEGYGQWKLMYAYTMSSIRGIYTPAATANCSA